MVMPDKVKLTSFGGGAGQSPGHRNTTTSIPPFFQTHTLRRTTKVVFPYGARLNICYYAQQDEFM